MDNLLALGDALQKGGPWVFLAISLFVIKYLYQAREADAKAHALEKQELNDRLLSIIKEQTTVITVSNENQKQLIAAINSLEV
jgi:hypothetical protein